MKQISFWAKDHKFVSRILIIFGFFFLNITGLFLGDLLHSTDVRFSPLFCFIATVMFISGTIFYPSKKNKKKYADFYRRQKLADGVLIFSTFLLLIYFGNSVNENRIRISQPVYGISIMPYSRAISSGSPVSIHAGKSSLSKKSVKKTFHKRIKDFRKRYKNSTETEKTILIVLCLLAGGAAIVLLMGLCCSLACSGAEGLALVVGIVGGAGIIFGLIKLIQRIKRGPKTEKPLKVEKKTYQALF